MKKTYDEKNVLWKKRIKKKMYKKKRQQKFHTHTHFSVFQLQADSAWFEKNRLKKNQKKQK